MESYLLLNRVKVACKTDMVPLRSGSFSPFHNIFSLMNNLDAFNKNVRHVISILPFRTGLLKMSVNGQLRTSCAQAILGQL